MRGTCRWMMCVLLLSTVGCGKALYVLDVNDNLQKWTNHAQPATARVSATMSARVVATPSMVVVADMHGRQLVSLPAGEGEEQSGAKAMLENPNTLAAVLVKGFGTAVAERCRYHLSQVFENATVDLGPASPQVIQIVPTGLVFVPGFYSRRASVQLTATPPGGAPIVVSATSQKASAAGHLGWALPLIMVHGLVLGFAIVSPIFTAIYKGIEEDKALEAVDLACADLAARLATMPLAQYSPPR